jgi:hypothetical protein
VAALQGASNRLVNVEDLDEDELRVLQRPLPQPCGAGRAEADIHESHLAGRGGPAAPLQDGDGKTADRARRR